MSPWWRHNHFVSSLICLLLSLYCICTCHKGFIYFQAEVILFPVLIANYYFFLSGQYVAIFFNSQSLTSSQVSLVYCYIYELLAAAKGSARTPLGPTTAVALLQVTLFINVFPKNGNNDTHWYMPHWFQESSIIKYLSMSLIIYNVTFILLLAGSIESLVMSHLLFKLLTKSA